MNNYKLSDPVIAHIAQLVQMAIITGTDITDNFRTIRMEPSELDPDSLVLTQECANASEENISRMIKEAQEISAQMEKESTNPQVM